MLHKQLGGHPNGSDVERAILSLWWSPLWRNRRRAAHSGGAAQHRNKGRYVCSPQPFVASSSHRCHRWNTTIGALFFDFHNIVSSLPPEVYLDDDIHLQDDPYSIIELNIMTRTVLAGWPLDEPNDVEAPPHLVDGKLVMGSDQPHIYLVEQQTLRKIPDMATFEAHGWDFDDVARVWQASLDRYPRGPDIPIA